MQTMIDRFDNMKRSSLIGRPGGIAASEADQFNMIVSGIMLRKTLDTIFNVNHQGNYA
jgi:hypothetical protein